MLRRTPHFARRLLYNVRCTQYTVQCTPNIEYRATHATNGQCCPLTVVSVFSTFFLTLLLSLPPPVSSWVNVINGDVNVRFLHTLYTVHCTYNVYLAARAHIWYIYIPSTIPPIPPILTFVFYAYKYSSIHKTHVRIRIKHTCAYTHK